MDEFKIIDSDIEELDNIAKMKSVINCSILENGLSKPTHEFYFCSCDLQQKNPICRACIDICHKGHSHSSIYYLNQICQCGLKNHYLPLSNPRDFNYKNNNKCYMHEISLITGLGVYYEANINKNFNLCFICEKFCKSNLDYEFVLNYKNKIKSKNFRLKNITNSKKTDIEYIKRKVNLQINYNYRINNQRHLIPNCNCNIESHSDAKYVYKLLGKVFFDTSKVLTLNMVYTNDVIEQNIYLDNLTPCHLTNSIFSSFNLFDYTYSVFENFFILLDKNIKESSYTFNERIDYSNPFWALVNIASLCKQEMNFYYYLPKLMNLFNINLTIDIIRFNVVNNDNKTEDITKFKCYYTDSFDKIVLESDFRKMYDYSIYDFENLTPIQRLIITNNDNTKIIENKYLKNNNLIDILMEGIEMLLVSVTDKYSLSNDFYENKFFSFLLCFKYCSIIYRFIKYYMFDVSQAIKYLNLIELLFISLSKVQKKFNISNKANLNNSNTLDKSYISNESNDLKININKYDVNKKQQDINSIVINKQQKQQHQNIDFSFNYINNNYTKHLNNQELKNTSNKDSSHIKLNLNLNLNKKQKILNYRTCKYKSSKVSFAIPNKQSKFYDNKNNSRLKDINNNNNNKSMHKSNISSYKNNKYYINSRSPLNNKNINRLIITNSPAIKPKSSFLFFNSPGKIPSKVVLDNKKIVSKKNLKVINSSKELTNSVIDTTLQSISDIIDSFIFIFLKEYDDKVLIELNNNNKSSNYQTSVNKNLINNLKFNSSPIVKLIYKNCINILSYLKTNYSNTDYNYDFLTSKIDSMFNMSFDSNDMYLIGIKNMMYFNLQDFIKFYYKKLDISEITYMLSLQEKNTYIDNLYYNYYTFETDWNSLYDSVKTVFIDIFNQHIAPCLIHLEKLDYYNKVKEIKDNKNIKNTANNYNIKVNNIELNKYLEYTDKEIEYIFNINNNCYEKDYLSSINLKKIDLFLYSNFFSNFLKILILYNNNYLINPSSNNMLNLSSSSISDSNSYKSNNNYNSNKKHNSLSYNEESLYEKDGFLINLFQILFKLSNYNLNSCVLLLNHTFIENMCKLDFYLYGNEVCYLIYKCFSMIKKYEYSIYYSVNIIKCLINMYVKDIKISKSYANYNHTNNIDSYSSVINDSKNKYRIQYLFILLSIIKIVISLRIDKSNISLQLKLINEIKLGIKEILLYDNLLLNHKKVFIINNNVNKNDKNYISYFKLNSKIDVDSNSNLEQNEFNSNCCNPYIYYKFYKKYSVEDLCIETKIDLYFNDNAASNVLSNKDIQSINNNNSSSNNNSNMKDNTENNSMQSYESNNISKNTDIVKEHKFNNMNNKNIDVCKIDNVVKCSNIYEDNYTFPKLSIFNNLKEKIIENNNNNNNNNNIDKLVLKDNIVENNANNTNNILVNENNNKNNNIKNIKSSLNNKIDANNNSNIDNNNNNVSQYPNFNKKTNSTNNNVYNYNNYYFIINNSNVDNICNNNINPICNIVNTNNIINNSPKKEINIINSSNECKIKTYINKTTNNFSNNINNKETPTLRNIEINNINATSNNISFSKKSNSTNSNKNIENYTNNKTMDLMSEVYLLFLEIINLVFDDSLNNNNNEFLESILNKKEIKQILKNNLNLNLDLRRELLKLYRAVYIDTSIDYSKINTYRNEICLGNVENTTNSNNNKSRDFKVLNFYRKIISIANENNSLDESIELFLYEVNNFEKIIKNNIKNTLLLYKKDKYNYNNSNNTKYCNYTYNKELKNIFKEKDNKCFTLKDIDNENKKVNNNNNNNNDTMNMSKLININNNSEDLNFKNKIINYSNMSYLESGIIISLRILFNIIFCNSDTLKGFQIISVYELLYCFLKIKLHVFSNADDFLLSDQTIFDNNIFSLKLANLKKSKNYSNERSIKQPKEIINNILISNDNTEINKLKIDINAMEKENFKLFNTNTLFMIYDYHINCLVNIDIDSSSIKDTLGSNKAKDLEEINKDITEDMMNIKNIRLKKDALVNINIFEKDLKTDNNYSVKATNNNANNEVNNKSNINSIKNKQSKLFIIYKLLKNKLAINKYSDNKNIIKSNDETNQNNTKCKIKLINYIILKNYNKLNKKYIYQLLNSYKKPYNNIQYNLNTYRNSIKDTKLLNNYNVADNKIKSNYNQYQFKTNCFDELELKICNLAIGYSYEKNIYSGGNIIIVLSEINLEKGVNYRNILVKYLFETINSDFYMNNNSFNPYTLDCYIMLLKLLQSETKEVQKEIIIILEEQLRFNNNNNASNIKNNNDSCSYIIDLAKLTDKFLFQLVSIILNLYNYSSINLVNDYIFACIIIKIFKFLCEEHNNYFQEYLLVKLNFKYFNNSNKQFVKFLSCKTISFYHLMLEIQSKIILISGWNKKDNKETTKLDSNKVCNIVDIIQEYEATSINSRNNWYFFELFACINELLIEIVQGSKESSFNEIIIDNYGLNLLNNNKISKNKEIDNIKSNNVMLFQKKKKSLAMYINNIKGILLENHNLNNMLKFMIKKEITEFLLAFLEEKNVPLIVKNLITFNFPLKRLLLLSNNIVKLLYINSKYDDYKSSVIYNKELDYKSSINDDNKYLLNNPNFYLHNTYSNNLSILDKNTELNNNKIANKSNNFNTETLLINKDNFKLKTNNIYSIYNEENIYLLKMYFNSLFDYKSYIYLNNEISVYLTNRYYNVNDLIYNEPAFQLSYSLYKLIYLYCDRYKTEQSKLVQNKIDYIKTSNVYNKYKDMEATLEIRNKRLTKFDNNKLENSKIRNSVICSKNNTNNLQNNILRLNELNNATNTFNYKNTNNNKNNINISLNSNILNQKINNTKSYNNFKNENLNVSNNSSNIYKSKRNRKKSVIKPFSNNKDNRFNTIINTVKYGNIKNLNNIDILHTKSRKNSILIKQKKHSLFNISKLINKNYVNTNASKINNKNERNSILLSYMNNKSNNNTNNIKRLTKTFNIRNSEIDINKKSFTNNIMDKTNMINEEEYSSDNDFSLNKIDNKYFEDFFFFEFFKSITRVVEINYNNLETRIVFLMPDKTRHLYNNSKDVFINNVDRESRFQKLNSLMKYSKYFRIEMNYNSISKKSIFDKINYFLIQRILYLFIIIVNIFFIFVYEKLKLNEHNNVLFNNSYNYSNYTLNQDISNSIYNHTIYIDTDSEFFYNITNKEISINNLTEYNNNNIIVYIKILELIINIAFLFIWSIYKLPLKYQIEIEKLKEVILKKHSLENQENQYEININKLTKIKIIIYQYLSKDVITFSWNILFAVIAFTTKMYTLLFTFQLLSIINLSKLLNNLVVAILSRATTLGSVGLLMILINYIFSSIAMFLFSDKFYNNTLDEYTCTTLFECFFIIFGSYKLRPGVGNIITRQIKKDNLILYYSILIYINAYFVILTIFLLNIILAVILETFNTMRLKYQKILYDKANVCFICGGHKNSLEKQGINFNKHISEEHNMWNYMFYIIKISSSQIQDLNSVNSYACEMIVNKNIKFFPEYKERYNVIASNNNVTKHIQNKNQVSSNCNNYLDAVINKDERRSNYESDQIMKSALKEEVNEEIVNCNEEFYDYVETNNTAQINSLFYYSLSNENFEFINELKKD